MRSARLLLLTALVLLPIPARAQQATGGVLGAVQRDLDQVEEKLVGLAEAIPADKWDWRPSDGVRSVREVFLHVASDNYFLPIPLGLAAPAETGITATDFEGPVRYEKRGLAKPEAIAALKASFAHMDRGLAGAREGNLDERVDLFGSSMSRREVWLLTAFHLHEHLGQLIAYARTNGVVPPWSR